MILNSKAAAFVKEFIQKEQLPDVYAATVSRFFGRTAARILAMVHGSDRPQIVGINGAQGTGKSTVSACIAGLLAQQGLRVLVLSIDDLYLTRAQRERLAEKVHPLLKTRGVPGTHDMALGRQIIAAVRGELNGAEVDVPRFDKASDDRCAQGTPFPAEGVDVLLFEGWCVGAKPQHKEALGATCNALERDYDADVIWRTYVNDALAGVYADVFAELDYLIMLKPPGFEAVYRWRGEQEEKLRRKLASEGLSKSCAMDEMQLTRFISHYERLTRWMFEEMPIRADEVFLINDDHQVMGEIRKNRRFEKIIVYTDLDAALVNDANQWEDAREALEWLAKENACVVLGSFKTVDEMRQISNALIKECGLQKAPIVAENGQVVALPDVDAANGYRLQYMTGAIDTANGLQAALQWCRQQNTSAIWRVIVVSGSPDNGAIQNAVDIAVVIPNPLHEQVPDPLALYGVYPQNHGPKGWNEAILEILEDGI
ncbi:MAG: hypothetical protein JXR76_02155 [Deltaproteobacteria bacterium]|nr:hypothetical protein [Deltaproteobacteria bacterium]